jgi:hypothetical protein
MVIFKRGFISISKLKQIIPASHCGGSGSIPGQYTRHLWWTKWHWARAAAPPPKLPKTEIQKTQFLDIMISEVLRGLPFCRNQPLKSADDQYIKILRNKLINLKKQEDRPL